MTKSPENFCKAWGHIQGGHRTFYARKCPISGIAPSSMVMEAIHKHFSLNTVFKATLCRLLYKANEGDKDPSLRRFLYDIQLSHTGMHIFPILFRSSSALNCTTETLFTELGPRHTSHKPTIKYMTDPSDAHRRKLWRYGRMFEQNFVCFTNQILSKARSYIGINFTTSDA
ncbi:hypothetical protein CRYUN_Cryun23aG0087000 [Craigia yunnanensis]